MAETELERAEKRYTQARARLQALKNREAAKERKLDTRRKVILGAALIDLAARDSHASAMLDRLIRNLPRDQDRKTFDGWDVKAAAVAPVTEAGAARAGSADAGERAFPEAVGIDRTAAETTAPLSPSDVGAVSDDDHRLRDERRRQAEETNGRRGPGVRL